MEAKKWVSAWANAASVSVRRPENYSRCITLRYLVFPAFGGKAIRAVFSNFCGTEPITVDRAFIALSDGGSGTAADTAVPLTFGGAASVTVPAGGEVLSDSVPFEVTAGRPLAVSFFLAGFTEMRTAVRITGPLSKGFFALGDRCTDPQLPPDEFNSTAWVYFLNRLDVLTDEKNRAVICYGDSITSQSWPDFLALRLKESGTGGTAVVRRAVSGTRILRQYSCIKYASYGLKGETRFEREMDVPGADTVIIQHGINDIIHPVGTEVNQYRPWSDLPSAQQLIDGLRAYIETARRLGLRVYLGTLLPIEGWRTYAPFRDGLRCAVNDWIRTSGEADGYIDFDAAVRDAEHPSRFAPGFDSGDHLHPSDAAYNAMAAAAQKVLFPDGR